MSQSTTVRSPAKLAQSPGIQLFKAGTFKMNELGRTA